MLHRPNPNTKLKNRVCYACRTKRLTQSGFSLTEVLVSVFVLSIGLIGMLGMQAAALQANREARLQSSAVVLARELAEMIRGSKSEGVKTTDNPYVGSFSSPLSFGSPSYCLNVSSTSACNTPNDVAKAQMTEWLTRVDSELPGAKVIVCFDTTPFDANGLPRWDCSDKGPALVIKIGWTRVSTDKSKSGASMLERATIPSLVTPVEAGSSV